MPSESDETVATEIRSTRGRTRVDKMSELFFAKKKHAYSFIKEEHRAICIEGTSHSHNHIRIFMDSTEKLVFIINMAFHYGDKTTPTQKKLINILCMKGGMRSNIFLSMKDLIGIKATHENNS